MRRTGSPGARPPRRWRGLGARLLPSSVAVRAALAAAVVAAVVVGLGLDTWRRNLTEMRFAAVWNEANDGRIRVEAALDAGGLAGLRSVTDVHYEIIDRGGRVIAASSDVKPLEVDGRPVQTRSVAGGDGWQEIVAPAGSDSALTGRPLAVLQIGLQGVDAGTVPTPPIVVYDPPPPFLATVFVDADPYTFSGSLDGALRWQAALAVLLAAAAVGLVSRLALRPVSRMSAQAARITTGRLHHRLPEPAGRDPVARLAVTVNAMLDRLQEADDQQRRFVADAAHEMRSPLASLRTMLAVAQAHPDPARLEAVVEAAAAETERLTRLSEDLLLLARLDARAAAVEGVVDLTDPVCEEAGRRAASACRVEVFAPVPVLVHGVESQLRQVVVNLLDNAERHARTRVRVEVRRAGDRAVLEVSDDGPGIPVGDRQRVFERFVRLDSARDRHSGGSGLGLAIVRDVVAAHHGRVSIEDAEPGVRIVVDLPGCVMADGGEQP